MSFNPFCRMRSTISAEAFLVVKIVLADSIFAVLWVAILPILCDPPQRSHYPLLYKNPIGHQFLGMFAGETVVRMNTVHPHDHPAEMQISNGHFGKLPDKCEFFSAQMSAHHDEVDCFDLGNQVCQRQRIGLRVRSLIPSIYFATQYAVVPAPI